MSNKALLVMDMQVDFCRDIRRRDKVAEMLAPLQQVIALFASQGCPVYYPCLILPENDPQFARFGDRYCIRGTPGAEIIPELLPLQGTLIDKQKHSAFFETNLDELLKQQGVTELFLTGLQTHICIMTTAADASFRGYRTVAIRECVISSTEENKTNALHWIASYVGEVISLEKVGTEMKRGE